VIPPASMPFTTFCFVCFCQPTFCRVCMFINKHIKKLKSKVSLPEATIFFKRILWLNAQNYLCGKTFLALEVSTTSQSSTKKVIFKFANKWVKREASRNRNEVYHFRRDRWRVTTTTQNSNAGACFANAVIRDVHTCCCILNTWNNSLSANDDKRTIQPDKIHILAPGFQGWGQTERPKENRRTLGKTRGPGVGNSYAILGRRRTLAKTRNLGWGISMQFLGIVEKMI